MKMIGCLVLCICFFWRSASAEEQTQTFRIRHDPFQKPAIQEKKLADPAVSENSPPVEAKPPRLIATLRAGKNSMANVNGKIIKVGETVNGYKLVRVEARRAMFEKNKQYAYLTIDNPTDE